MNPRTFPTMPRSARACAGGEFMPSSPMSWTPILRVLETWIVEGGDRRFAGLGHEHVCRSIVGTGGERHPRARWDRRDKIAFAGVQSLAHEPASLGAPHELQGSLEIVGDEPRRSCSRNRLRRNRKRADCSDRRRPLKAAHQPGRSGRRSGREREQRQRANELRG